MKQQSEQRTVVELIKVLRTHPKGLRRWSVMRAMRARCEAAGLDVSQKFEDDVERAFRRFCAGADAFKSTNGGADDALFFRPEERAGEVWAVYTDRADAWLDGHDGRFG